MLAVDTNVLARIWVDDPGAPEQCAAARRLASSAGVLFVSSAVQLEVAWVLRASFGLDKREILALFSGLLPHPAYEWQRADALRAALAEYQSSHDDFADCLILAEARLAGLQLATFDRKLARLKDVCLASKSP